MKLTIEDYKNEFREREGIHFNNAGMAPISRRVVERITSSVFQLEREGTLLDAAWVPELKVTREKLARFLGAELHQVAFSGNCAQALSQVAFGFPLTSHDSVVTIDQEYASNFYPWSEACKRTGAKLVVCESEPNKQLSLEKLIALIVPGVKLVGISWVQFQTGAIIDLKRLGSHCKSVGAYLIVDGIQGLGQLPFSFRDLPIDFITGASHKWICSINGQGFFAVKDELLAKLAPLAVGSANFNRFGTFADPDATLEKSARKFEAGGVGYIPLFALTSALTLIEEVSVEVIALEISRLSQKLRVGLLQKKQVKLFTPLEQVGGITSFTLPFDQEFEFLKRAKSERVALVKRGEFIRISLHAFCTDNDVERVLGFL